MMVVVVVVMIIGCLSKLLLSEARQPEVKFLHSLGSGFTQIFWEIVSAGVMTLYSSTNSVASRNILKKGNGLTCGVAQKRLGLSSQ